MRFQRLVQIPVFVLFLYLLARAAYPLPSWIRVDLFLRLDPLLSLGTMAAARSLIPGIAWALAAVGLALVLGRVFCGYLCPMGTTLDLLHRGFRPGKKGKSNSYERAGRVRQLKYLFLAGLFGSALLGISYVFLFSPLSLITRFYGLVIYPLAPLLSNALLDLLRPVFPLIGLGGWSYLAFKTSTFDTNLFVAGMLLGIFLLDRFAPRFWCRNLCPAGAILALFGRKPLLRRRVSEDCTQCGRCLGTCPMGAIGEDFVTTAHSECITCLTCRDVCPVGAVTFKAAPKSTTAIGKVDPGRRKLLAAGLAGAATAALTMTNLRYLHGGEDPRPLLPSRLIRPPGALPEPAFQARCVRCGECMKGCLTNTLQPVWFEAGISGIWSPKITARLAGCEQNCNACGHLCPTGAIRPLDLEEKKHAKVGTARIILTRCIAWEQERSCLICDEICPYNAISNQFAPGHSVTVPVIDENRCNGCGYCENKCPVAGEAAIVVEPLGEMRLGSGSYREKARELGLVYHARGDVRDDFILEGVGTRGRHGKKDNAEVHTGSDPGLPPGFLAD